MTSTSGVLLRTLAWQDKLVDCHDEFFADFLKSTCNTPRKFRTNYFPAVLVIRVQWDLSVLCLKGLSA